MKLHLKIALVTGALALSVAPAMAAGNVPSSVPPCKGEGKQHVDGQKGTPFSQCVTAMAKLANGNTTNPAKACKGESRKHAKGEKGTPFSRCVVATARLAHAQQS